MKKFNFRMDSILDLRKQKEDEIKREMAVLLNEKYRIEEELSILTRKREDTLIAIREKSNGKGGAHVISQSMEMKLDGGNQYYYLKVLGLRIEEAWFAMHRIDRAIEDKREELLEASKERKTVERLKERKRDEYIKEVLREEQNIIDEIAQGKRMSASTESKGARN